MCVLDITREVGMQSYDIIRDEKASNQSTKETKTVQVT